MGTGREDLSKLQEGTCAVSRTRATNRPVSKTFDYRREKISIPTRTN